MTAIVLKAPKSCNECQFKFSMDKYSIPQCSISGESIDVDQSEQCIFKKGGEVMGIKEAIAELAPCDTCERVRYPEKYCVTCTHNPKWYDNYKMDQNVEHLVNLLEADDDAQK